MGLRLKFNLVLILVFAAGFAAAGMVSYRLLQDNAKEEVLRDASLMMEAALSVRQYTVDQIKPELIKLMDDETFLPQTVPAYAATETLNQLRKKYPEYGYKEATLNPTNPRDRATDWEADIVTKFRQDGATKEIVAERNTPTGRQLYIARPIQITNAACLQCHTTAEMAPPSMIKMYGTANGFGWKHNEIIGAQVVTVPMDVPIQHARHAFVTFMSSLGVVFVVVFIVLNLMLSQLIIAPIRRISAAADGISNGDFSQPEFKESGKDEVATLSRSFNRMRRSLEKAMQMIDDGS